MLGGLIKDVSNARRCREGPLHPDRICRSGGLFEPGHGDMHDGGGGPRGNQPPERLQIGRIIFAYFHLGSVFG